MNSEHHKSEEPSQVAGESLRQRLIDSLLIAALSPQERVDIEARITTAMAHISENAVSASNVRHHPVSNSVPHRWVIWTITASVLVGFFVIYQINSQDRLAWAAVAQCLSAASREVPRRYDVSIAVNPPAWSAQVIECELYVQGNNRFALRHPGWIPGTSFWLGQDGEESWVAPAIGPVRVGDNTGLSRWLAARQEVATPYLHVTTVLERMSRGYKLEKLPDERLETGLADQSAMICQHIRGELHDRLKDRDLPDRIELWAETAGGLAVRMLLEWDHPVGKFGRNRIELRLADVSELPEGWFQHQSHAPHRQVIRLDSSVE